MIQLNAGQSDALDVVTRLVDAGQKIISLSGSAGTGKTTMVRETLDSLGQRAVVVAPTNKAATMLQSKGVDAATFYKRFFVVDDTDKLKLRFIAGCDWSGDLPDGKLRFSPVILLDEASMLGSWALGKLRSMCDTLILVGDGNQLPPIGDRDNPRGYFCSRKHDATLTQVMRNEGKILQLATAIRTSEDGFRLKGIDLDDFYPNEDFETVFLLDRPQLISYRNLTRQALNARARQVLGYEGVLPLPGDLMVCRSNYSDDLLNGTQATVRTFFWQEGKREGLVELELGDGSVRSATLDMLYFFKDQTPKLGGSFVDMLRDIPLPGEEELLHLTFGYCVTAHTAQGGEWSSVCVVDERSTVKSVALRAIAEDPRSLPPEEYVKRWFYTACTRAQHELYVVNERWTKG